MPPYVSQDGLYRGPNDTIGFHTTFLVQQWLGNMGMPRRYADYLPTDGFTALNGHLNDRGIHARGFDAAVRVERVP
jgi:hypothetical protein